MSSPLEFTVRPERGDEADAIGELLDAAFGGTRESRLVERLRANGEMLLALVAVRNTAIVGFAGWPRLLLETPQGSRPVAGLAPLAVAPAWQRRGIGAALTSRGLTELHERGENLVFVLGDPDYYQRFGFSLEAARAYGSIFAGNHFMALELAATAPKSGRVLHPAPFHSLT